MKENTLYGGRIMKGYIRGTAIAFGDFKAYEINPKSVYDLIVKFSDYNIMPNVVDEIAIEIQDNIPKQKVFKRIQLFSEENKFTVNIGTDRIVVEALTTIEREKNTVHIDLEKFTKNVNDIFKILLDILKEKFTRISLVVTNLTEGNMREQYNKCMKENNYFEGKEIIEWNTRTAAREGVPVLPKEIVNVICETSRAKGTISSSIPEPGNYSFEGVVREIDINTIPENMEKRIDCDFLDKFYPFALEKMKEIERMMINEE